MGGSGSGRYSIGRNEAEELRREAEEASRRAQIDADVNAMLNRRLIEINRRNSELVEGRLSEIEAALSAQIEGFDRFLYGGSVSKQTYVEGLSDIDALLVLDPNRYGDLAPSEVLANLSLALESALDRGETPRIRAGDLAVTVTYSDGLELQLLPTLERGDQLAIKAARSDRWSEIDPRSFGQALSAVNQNQAGAIVPAIKLAKVILSSAPETQRPSGYHLEALAIAAFRDYAGPRNPKAMLTRLFESASKNVLSPIADVSGQSKHIDEALGPRGSAERKALSRSLISMARRMENAANAAAWKALLGDE